MAKSHQKQRAQQPNEQPKMESLHQLLRRTIREGAPVYNEGNHQGCYEIYVAAITHALSYIPPGKFMAIALEEALNEAAVLADIKHNYTEAAWVLRRSIDDILEIRENDIDTTTAVGNENTRLGKLASSSTKSLLFVPSSSSTTTVKTSNIKSTKRLSQITEQDRDEEWQDEQGINISDYECAQHLSHTYAILLSSAHLQTHRREKATYEETTSASDLTEILVELGLSNHRRSALDVVSKLTQIGFLILVYTPSTENGRHRDGLNLYQFPSNEELEKQYMKLKNQKSQLISGTIDNVAYLALGEFLEKFDDDDDDDDSNFDIHFDPNRNSAVKLPTVSKPLALQQLKKVPQLNISMADHESNDDPKLISKGVQLAVAMVQVEPCLKLDDRRYGLKTYQQCFVGSDAVSLLVTKNIMPSRESATKLLNKLLQIGFIEHVAKEHNFEDKRLFYYIVSRKHLQDKLSDGIKTDHINDDIITEHAIIERLKQFPKLSVTEILNWFYGCYDNEEEGGRRAESNIDGGGDSGGDNNNMNMACWDVVDLQIWRNNMKRWGFGRREDQDDEMIDKLSPLALAVDPDEWNMEEQDPEWSTPWGILAQIAIFDQVPRSAFRGTADAFKWDALAIKATKYAIEKGYFETAYKSTLNRFVLLLPLEHSESWEDQKLGVNLLLQMLSTVAIEDEGLSEYEIVKRLEFSKRLTTAFLEHAQVIAKFKKFPHRNKAHGRPTTIEERVWLASDLVPRWAKSQQHTDEQDHPKKSIIQVPVIPLKRLTRG